MGKGESEILEGEGPCIHWTKEEVHTRPWPLQCLSGEQMQKLLQVKCPGLNKLQLGNLYSAAYRQSRSELCFFWYRVS